MFNEEDPGDRQDATALSKFSARTRRALEAFRRSGMAERIEREAEAEAIEVCRARVKQRVAARKAYEAKKPSMEAECAKTAEAAEAAEQAARAARAEANAAQQRATGHELAFLAEDNRLRAELRASADPRIAEFWLHLDNVRSEGLPSALDIRPNMERLRGNKWAPAVVTNTDEVHAAKVAVEAALQVVDALHYEPLGYTELSERLVAICESLAKVLAPVLLNPPSLTAADAEPGPALTFREAPQWIVEQAVAARGEEVAARRAEAASRIAASAKVN